MDSIEANDPMSLSRQGRHDEAIAAAQRDVDEVRESAAAGSEDLVIVLNILGCVLQIGGRHHEALTAFAQSIGASASMNDQEQRRIKRIVGLCNLGETHCLLGDGQTARKTLENAFAMIEAGPEVDPLMRGGVIGCLGWAAELLGDLEEAERLLLEGLSIAKAAGIEGQERDHLDRLAVVLARRGDGKGAERIRQKLVELRS